MVGIPLCRLKQSHVFTIDLARFLAQLKALLSVIGTVVAYYDFMSRTASHTALKRNFCACAFEVWNKMGIDPFLVSFFFSSFLFFFL